MKADPAYFSSGEIPAIEKSKNIISPKSNPEKTAWDNLNRPVAALYEEARFQKMYGGEITEPDMFFHPAFLRWVVRAGSLFPGDLFSVAATFAKFDDLANPLSYSGFLQRVGNILPYVLRSSVRHGRGDYITAKITAVGKSLKKVVGSLAAAHFLYISPLTPGIGPGTGAYSPDAHLLRKCRLLRGSLPHCYPHRPRFRRIRTPDPESFAPLVAGIHSWLIGRRATAIKTVTGPAGSELRFYRNSYAEGEKCPINYADRDVLQTEILKGAFAWVSDSHAFTGTTPTGPYWATIDIDIGDVEVHTLARRVEEFYDFAADLLGVAPLLIHSGNDSVHFRWVFSKFPPGLAGQVLPKNIAWETYYRRHREELNVIYLKNAVELLTLMYNEVSELGPVACGFAKYPRSRYSEFFDNRTGMQQGARVPGSFHHKSGRYARLLSIDDLPHTAAEVRSMTSYGALLNHPEAVHLPQLSEGQKQRGLEQLIGVTDDYYRANFRRLVYTEGIFNG